MRKSHVVFLALLALSVSPRPAAAADRLACQTAGIITKCPADAQLAAGSVLQSAFVPWSAAPAGSIPNSALVTTPPTLSSSTPSAIGTAAAGLGTTASRFDHVHALPAVGTAGTYVYPISITTDAQGRATGITAGSAPQAASADLTALSGFGSGLGIPVRTSATPTWSISTTLTGIAISCASNTCSNIANAALLAGIDALKVGSGIVSNTEYDYLDGVTSPIQTQIDGLGVLVNLLVNDGYTLFLHRTASDIATYETLRSEPATGIEKIDTVNVTSGTGPVLLGSYATDPGVPGVGTLPSGMWGFREFAGVNNTGGTSTILVRVYSRTVGGTETLLFQSTSPTLTTTSASLYYWIYTQTNDIALDPTDRIVVKFYGQTTSGAVRSVSHYYEGSTHASWLSTPMPGPIPVSGAQAQIVATPATQTGQVALRSLTTDYLPLTSVVAGSYPTAGQIPTFAVNANGLLTAAGSISSLSGVTINCSSNTCSNVSLTAAVTGVLPVVNGGTNSSTALGGNRAMVSSGGKIVETASTCPPGTVLGGGSPPDCTAAATIGTSLATPRVDATAGSGTLILNALTGNPVQLSVNSTTVLQAASGSITASQPLAMSSQKITGLATATTSGDALSWPWVTATNGSASLSSSPYNIASGSFTSIGLALSLPSAGTYYLSADLRTLINASLGTGGFIECQLYNTTDAAAIANTERIGAYEPVVNQQYYGQISINEIITIAAAKTIDVQCLRSGATTYTTSGVYSDANGRSRFSYIKVSP